MVLNAIITFLFFMTSLSSFAGKHITSATHDVYIHNNHPYLINKSTGQNTPLSFHYHAKSITQIGNLYFLIAQNTIDRFHIIRSPQIDFGTIDHSYTFPDQVELGVFEEFDGIHIECCGDNLLVYGGFLNDLRVFSKDLVLLAQLDTDGECITNIHNLSPTEVLARSPFHLFKVDLTTLARPRNGGVPFQTTTLFTPSHLYHYTPTTLETRGPSYFQYAAYNDPSTHETIVTKERLYFMAFFGDLVFVFDVMGTVYAFDPVLGLLSTRDATKFSAAHFYHGVHILDCVYVNLTNSDDLWVFDLRRGKWVGQRKIQHSLSYGFHTQTHLDLDDNLPLFPSSHQIALLKKWGQLGHFANSSKDTFLFTDPNLPLVNLTQEFKDLVPQVISVGRLSYELIFDFLDPTLTLIIISQMESEHKTRYFASGEWKRRQNKLINLLCYRLWLNQTERAQSLLMGLVLINDPVALDICKQADTWGLGDYSFVPLFWYIVTALREGDFKVL